MEEKHEKVEKPKREGPPRGAAGRTKTSNRYSFDLKLKAVKLYLEEGFTNPQITEELKLGPSTLAVWIREYRAHGKSCRLTVQSSVRFPPCSLRPTSPPYGSSS